MQTTQHSTPNQFPKSIARLKGIRKAIKKEMDGENKTFIKKAESKENLSIAIKKITETIEILSKIKYETIDQEENLPKKYNIQLDPVALKITIYVIKKHKIDIDTLFKETQKREITEARQEIMYRLKKEGYSFPAIAFLTYKNRATVRHGCKIIQNLIDTNQIKM